MTMLDTTRWVIVETVKPLCKSWELMSVNKVNVSFAGVNHFVEKLSEKRFLCSDKGKKVSDKIKMHCGRSFHWGTGNKKCLLNVTFQRWEGGESVS